MGHKNHPSATHELLRIALFEGGLDFFNLFCVAVGVDGNHQQHLVAIHRSIEQRVGSYSTAQIVAAILREFDSSRAYALETANGLSQGGESSRRLAHIRCLNFAVAVKSHSHDHCFPLAVDHRFRNRAGSQNLGKEIVLRYGDVLDAFQH